MSESDFPLMQQTTSVAPEPEEVSDQEEQTERNLLQAMKDKLNQSKESVEYQPSEDVEQKFTLRRELIKPT